MKYLFSIIILCSAQALIAQYVTDSSPTMNAYIEQIAYQSEEVIYSEVHISFEANTINHIKIDSLIQGEVEITIAYLQNDTVVHYNKSVASTPMAKVPANFFVIKRTGIKEEGKYDMQVFIKDINAPSNTYSFSEAVEFKKVE